MLTLDEYHIYRVNGRIVQDSATGILKKLGYIDTAFYDEYSANRGRLVHLVNKLHVDGELDETTVDPILLPYFQATLRFLADSGFIITRSEFMLYCPEWDYACTVDFEGYFSHAPRILYFGDWKSGKMQDWTRYQLALECNAQGEYRRRVGVELRKNGTYKTRIYNDHYDLPSILDELKQYRQENR